MTSIKIDAHSHVGEVFAADLKSGAVAFDEAKGAFFKPATQQEYLRTNQDRLVRVDGAVGTLNEYSSSINDFCPIDALRDGEKFDRARRLTKNDVLAKPTWTQWAGETSLVVAQGAVTGAVLGTVGGAIYGIATHRRALPGSTAVDTGVNDTTAAVNAAGSRGGKPGIGVGRSGLHAAPYGGPFNPGNLYPPSNININMPPPQEPGMAQIAKEQMAQGAFGAAGAAIGAFCGPIGAAIGGLIGVGIGAIWNEAVR